MTLNSDGFRSMEFERRKEESIFFIGDSFTWGSTARPLDSSFASLVGKHFLSYNAGIPGADPDQYLAVAKAYLPKVQPTWCLLVIDESSDLVKVRRVVKPYKPVFYSTTAGGVNMCYFDSGKLVPFNCYSNAKHYHFELPFLWRTFRNGFNFLRYEALQPAIIDQYITKIDSICQANKIKFQTIVIPDNDALRPKHSYNYPVIYCNNLTEDDYYYGDDNHLNNSGHRKYADLILQFIYSQGY